MKMNLPNSLIVKGKFLKNNVDFGLANVYALCDNRGHQDLWNALGGVLQRHNLVAWCVLGDFNVVRSNIERRSRAVNNNNYDFAPFNHFIHGNFLVDLPLCGRNFTWYHGDGLSMSRLDRFLLSEVWFSLFPNCFQTALPRGLSDHFLISLTIDDQNWGPKPLRMLKCWSDIPGYSDFVKDQWLSIHVFGWSGFILKEKLKRLKVELRCWHLNHTSNIDGKIREAKNRLADLDVIGESRVLLSEEEAELHCLPADILALSKLQASMMWQKSCVTWLKVGDANTNFFHGIMSSRRRSNALVSLTVDGVSIEGVSEVRHTVYQHFKNHFKRTSNVRPDIGGLVFTSLSAAEGADLIKLFLLEEIKATIWDCNSFKCPGPDGINLGFFKDFWDMLKIDLLNFFAEFYQHGKLTKGLNSTFIALIPKVDSPQRVADFRPISLVSSVYKFLSNVLANRLRNVVGNVVSTTQSTCINGRQILDGILIANEILDDAKKAKKDLLFKVDFEKAYDSVDWGYLDEVMFKMNFPVLWCSWIMECVITATASVLVNGYPIDEFCFERRLRQGDPLSPFLFLLAPEGLNVMMKAMVANRIFTPYSIGMQTVVSVSHLQFADDTLLVGIKSWSNVRALKAVLILFESISGLKVNFNKSMLFGVNVNESWLHEAA